jgi:murein DD-endopeptidase MepM/ murein hydrolase activator NlpD
MAFPTDPTTGLLVPVAGCIVTQLYGPEHTEPELVPVYRKGYHTGIDFSGAPEGTDVRSPLAGTVVHAGVNGGYGQCVTIDGGDGVTAIFGHLSRIDVEPGDAVAYGQPLGGIGNTGVSTGVHLHFEVRRHGDDMDPTPWLCAGNDRSTVAEPEGMRAVTTRLVNLRRRPDEDAPVLGTVEAGTMVTIRRNGYLPVWVNGRAGWIWGEYLDLHGADEARPEPEAPREPADVVPDEPLPVAAGEPRSAWTTDDLNLRGGPGTDSDILTILSPGVEVAVLEERDAWLLVEVEGQQGFVHGDYVTFEPYVPPAAESRASRDGFFRSRADLTQVPLAPEEMHMIPHHAVNHATERTIADTWNRYGGLLGMLSDELGIDPAVAVAVLTIEAGGRGFGPTGRMIIRFENHIFWQHWGTAHPETFARHFCSDTDQPWTGHRWRPCADEDWRTFHGDQEAEWEVFTFARDLDEHAATSSISMGAPQIMGFNSTAIGCGSPREMFERFSQSEHEQIIGFFDFVQGGRGDSPRTAALQRSDFEAFAALYNGTGQAALYGNLMRDAAGAFQRLRSA